MDESHIFGDKWYSLHLALDSKGTQGWMCIRVEDSKKKAINLAKKEYRQIKAVPRGQHVICTVLHIADTEEECVAFHKATIKLAGELNLKED